MLGFFSGNGWRLWFSASLIFILAALAFVCLQRGHDLEIKDIQISALKLELAGLKEENNKLAVSAQAARTAVHGHGLIYRAEAERRNHIEEITEAKPVAIPEGAVDVGVSKKAVNLLNHDLFAPISSGLRRQAD